MSSDDAEHNYLESTTERSSWAASAGTGAGLVFLWDLALARAFRTRSRTRLFAPFAGTSAPSLAARTPVTHQGRNRRAARDPGAACPHRRCRPQGPRSKAVPLSDGIDAVENLLLLCGEHHRSSMTIPASTRSRSSRSTRAITRPRWHPGSSGQRLRPLTPIQSTYRCCRSPSYPAPCGEPSRCFGQPRRLASTCHVRRVSRSSRSCC